MRAKVVACLLAMVLLWPVMAVAPKAKAEFWAAGQDFWVNSQMGPVKSRVFRAADGNKRRVVYALDGMRAGNVLNGWEIETNIAQLLTGWNINVVMPVGGMSSFYTDWIAPSNFNGQRIRYAWETFITQDLRKALRDRLGWQATRNGVFGLSMGGSAALTLSAYHPDQFNYAGSFSGFLNISAPGMPEAIRMAMLDAGRFNVDDMWGPPWAPGWRRNDPFVFAPMLKNQNIRLYIACGSGVPTAYDIPSNSMGVWNDFTAIDLETLALANTRAFQARLMSIGDNNVVYDFPPGGIHSWPYWVDNVKRMVPDLSAHIG